MSEAVSGFVPFVERALDARERYEALGHAGERPRATGSSGPAWGAARSAAERVE